MAIEITRKNGRIIPPDYFNGVALQDFTLTYLQSNLSANVTADALNAGGALDQVFRTAVGTVGSVSRIGTLNTTTGVIRFAVESLGFDGDNAGGGFLGTGPDNEGTGTGNVGNTADALQAAVRALGTVATTVAGVTTTIVLSTATVVAFGY